MAPPTDWEDEIDKLNDRIDLLSKQIKNVQTATKEITGNIGDTNNLLGDALKKVQGIAKASLKFTYQLGEQYKLGEAMAKVSKVTAVNMGLSVGRAGEFTKTFNRAAAQVAKFGGEVSDVDNIMQRFADQSGRARIISEQEVLNVYLLHKGLGIAVETATEMMENMDLMGMNATEANRAIEEMVVSSQKLGLNSSKVAKTLANNFAQMQTFSFVGGVKGMTKMAEQAVKMRGDVSTMLSMSEKFYEPEAAIEAVANLQMLGGDIAQAFGDPFEVMYLARNKPEELAARVQEMTENMLQFNEETKQYELPAEARMQLKSAGDQLGINVDQMVEIARQSSKIKDIKMNIDSNIGDDDMREGIASLAKMDSSGNWVVDFRGEEIELGDTQKLQAAVQDGLLQAPADADEAIMDMAYNSMTTNEILDNILDAIKKGFVAQNNLYEGMEQTMGPTVQKSFQGIEKNIAKLTEVAQGGPLGQFQRYMDEQTKEKGFQGGKMGEKLFDGLEDRISEWNITADIDWDAAVEPIKWSKYIKPRADTTEGDITDSTEEEDFISRPGKLISIPSTETLVGYKPDGPIDRLLKNKSVDNADYSTSNQPMTVDFGTLSGRIVVENADGSNMAIDANKLQPLIENLIVKSQDRWNGGVPGGKFIPTNS